MTPTRPHGIAMQHSQRQGEAPAIMHNTNNSASHGPSGTALDSPRRRPTTEETDRKAE